ncbi:MAG: hypothetical protein ABSE73_32335 [Planctomycetota bacterium]
MTYLGKVKGCAVVLERAPGLADGTEVRVELEAVRRPRKHRDAKLDDLWDGLLKLAGTVKGLPVDMAENHDHYLYGTPKRKR